jgi:hypothetical protein
MKYEGKLYAKIAGIYIECTESVKDLEDRLKAQEEKHNEEMGKLKKIFESASYGCWDYLPKYNSWTNFDSGQTATTTELIEMFKKSITANG